jgi:DNA recombination protein RmuC
MTVIYILLALIIILLLFFIVRQKKTFDSEVITQNFFVKFNEKFPDLISQANQNLITMADQKLGAKKDEISTDLLNKREAIEKMVNQVLNELVKNQTRLEEAEKNRIGSFSALAQRLEEQKALTQQLSATTEGLKRVLSNNQLRGAFGEKVADDLLKMSGFVRGVDYEFNKEQANSSSRPDFTVKLPDGTKINVDAKFPYPNLVKMSETDDPQAKAEYLKAFERDVRDKIRQVCTRDYIDPESRTVDFVILFIPNEMIFSFIYDKLPSVWEEALTKKVVFAGPFSFTAILRMVRQAYDNFRFQNNIQQIIAHIQQFAKEFDNYSTEFDKIGDRIESLSKQYQAVSQTRTRQLNRIMDKIKLDPAAEANQPQLPN